MEIPDTLAFLAGRWSIERSITDHLSGMYGSFTGRGSVSPVEEAPGGPRSGRADYDETGTLTFGSHTGPAWRRLGYIRLDGGAVAVRFADGRPFVDLDLRGGCWRSVHPCGDDRYEITTFVRSADMLEERWRARGPTKSFDAVTVSTREVGAAE